MHQMQLDSATVVYIRSYCTYIYYVLPPFQNTREKLSIKIRIINWKLFTDTTVTMNKKESSRSRTNTHFSEVINTNDSNKTSW